MIIWILYCVIDILFNLICYLTNPIVLLFANEVGELPAIFKWWANWDDGLDIDWMIYEHHVPAWAEYDFNRHYKFHDSYESLRTRGIYCSYVDLLDPNFTLKERFQRYVCRLVWLYRNCAYGFSYYITGRNIDGSQIEELGNHKIIDNEYYWGRYKNWLTHEPFCYYLNKKWNVKDISWLQWTGIDHEFFVKIFLGWKFHYIKPKEQYRAMLALFAWPFRAHD